MSESSALSAASPQRNQRLAIFAVVGAVVVAVAVYLLLFSGGSSSTKPAAVASAPHAVPVAPASSSAPGVADQAIPAAFSGDPGRNPFQPAFTPKAVVAAASTTATTSTSAKASATPSQTVIVIPTLSLAPTTSATPTTSASPTPTVTVTATPSSSALPTSSTAITLTLTRADMSSTIDATVTGGSAPGMFTGVSPGTVFGTYFKLVSIVGSSGGPYGADFEYGDQFVQLASGQAAQLG